jgi:hypothetical protein
MSSYDSQEKLRRSRIPHEKHLRRREVGEGEEGEAGEEGVAGVDGDLQRRGEGG